MIQKSTMLKNVKKERIKINNLNEFKDALKREGYKINEFDEEKFKQEITKIFDIDNVIAERVHICINEADVTYRANDVMDFIDYIKKLYYLKMNITNYAKK